MLGSYKKGLSNDNYFDFEEVNFDGISDCPDLEYYERIKKDNNIYISNSEEIITNGKLGIYIINPYKWELKKK